MQQGYLVKSHLVAVKYQYQRKANCNTSPLDLSLAVSIQVSLKHRVSMGWGSQRGLDGPPPRSDQARGASEVVWKPRLSGLELLGATTQPTRDMEILYLRRSKSLSRRSKNPRCWRIQNRASRAQYLSDRMRSTRVVL
jgi:hypothetical protein